MSSLITTIGGRYLVESLLGRGATAVVFRVRDQETGTSLALKMLEDTDTQARLLFEQEFWTMRQLDHPGLVKAWHFGHDDQKSYFTMDLVAGPVVPDYGRLPLGEIRSLLEQLCPAMAYLHAQGLVHGDLKPQNLRFDNDNRLRLLDLGFLERAGQPSHKRGTLAYMPPEVIRGAPTDARSDLYALGVITYQLLAGRPPFQAEHPSTLLEMQLTALPEPLARLRDDLPIDVSEVVMRCLDKDLKGRPSSVGKVLEQLGWGTCQESHLVFGCSIFGRDPDLAELDSRVAEGLAGKRGIIALAGESGMGRSRILQEVVAVRRLSGTRTLALAGTGDRPLALVTDLLRAVDSNLPDDARASLRWQALRTLMPAWGETSAPLEPGAQEARLQQALALLLDDTFPNGLLVACDDWHLADQASTKLLAPLMERPGSNIAWLIADKATALDDAVYLKPLPRRSVDEFLEMVLSAAPQAALGDLVFKLSAGNPGRIRQILTHWRRIGALFWQSGRWQLDLNRAIEVPREWGVLLHEQLISLGESARAVAYAGAIMGQEFSLGDLAELVSGDLFEGVAQLEASGLLRRSGKLYRFGGMAREVVLMTIPSEEANRIHALAARRLESRGDIGSVVEAARHHLGAGSINAPQNALAAAKASLSFGMVTEAIKLLNAFERVEVDREFRLQADSLLGDACRLQGDAVRALAYYGPCIATCRDSGDLESLCRDLTNSGRAQMAMGDWEGARVGVEEALEIALAKCRLSDASRCLMTLGRVHFFKGDSEVAKALYVDALEIAKKGGIATLESQALSFLGVLEKPGEARGKLFLERAIEIQRQLQNPLGLIEALINLGDRFLAEGDLAKSEQVFGEALEISRQIGSRSEECVVLLNIAQLELDRGWPELCVKAARSGLNLATALGQDQQTSFALGLLAAATHRLGDYQAARELANRSLGTARRSGSRYPEQAASLTLAEILIEQGRLGDAAPAIETATTTAIRDPIAQTRALWLRGRFLVLIGEEADAQECLLAALEMANHQNLSLLGGLVEYSLAYQAWFAGDRLLSRTRATKALDIATGRRAEGLAAEANWLLGQLAAEEGQDKEACALFENVYRFASEAKLPVVQALAELGLGRSVRGGQLSNWLQEGEKKLRDLRGYAGTDGFFRWPERHLGGGSPSAESPFGAAEMLALMAEPRAASSQQDLLDRLLRRVIVAVRAEQGALLQYKEHQLVGYAVAGIQTQEIERLPDLDRAVLDLTSHLEPTRWLLPIANEGGELLGVLFAVGQRLSEGSHAALVAQALAQALGLFSYLRAFSDAATRLSFVEDLAHAALLASSNEGMAQAALGVLLRESGAQRAFLLRCRPGGDLHPINSLGIDGNSVALDTPISRSICNQVLTSRKSLALLDAQESGSWQQQQSILALGLRSIAAAPLVVGDEAVGVLYVDSDNVIELFGASVRSIVETAAEILAPLAARAD